jgi:tripartite-type tricarboxylate transporter receptor subunit TctC
MMGFSIIYSTVRAELVEAFSNRHVLRQAQDERIWFVTNYGKVNRLRGVLTFSALVCAVNTLITASALAAAFPERPLRIVTPFPAASTTDVIARPLAAKLTEAWGQPVVVDNRAGAGGGIAAEIVAKATPDGHTLLIGANGPNAVNPSLIKNLPYDSLRAFAPITLTTTATSLLVTSLSVPAKSVRELIELAKAKPAQLSYASPGIGSTPHLAGELFASLAGVKLVHVPYKGSAQYIVDMLASRMDLCLCAAGPFLPHIKSGRLRLLGVSTAKRDPAMPDVPTISEAGVPGFEVVGWFGVLTTAGTPAPVVKKLYAEIVRILAMPEVKTAYLNGGMETVFSNSPEEFAAFIRSERDKWAKVIKAANIRIE